jgi:Fe-S cluster biosynthesis and repair protein YggX
VPEADPHRIVHCIKLQEDLPGLKKPPFPTEFGQYLFEHVSKQAWDLWLSESVRYINTYRVGLSSRQGTEFMIDQLKIWLGLQQGEQVATAWTPPEGEGSKQ